MHPSPVEQIRAAIDIVALISEHVSLKKAGRTWKALCPFHTEKTPSFVVFPDTGRWHCFGCGEGGDAFSFLMKVENLSFVEALNRLAERVGVPISHAHDEAERKEENQRLYAANEAAAVYYHQLLLNSPAVLRYVAERGIGEGTVQSFLLGLAPESSDALRRALDKQGFTRDELERSGLLYVPDEGPVRDRYRGRLIFPIRDGEGRIVSFGGRTLNPEIQPKYLNGPQTSIFDKGSVLYGLHAGAQAIRKERRAVVVEGYVDVVIAHQEGFQNVVATLGTSITDRHLRQLARHATDICLALDPDTAGQQAAVRGAEVAREALVDAATPVPLPSGAVRFATTSRSTVRVVALPDGLDPDELILRDPERWRAAVDAAQPVIAYLLDRVSGRFDLASVQGKVDAVDALLPLLLEIPDPIQRDHYVELAAERVRTDAAALRAKLRAHADASRRRQRAQAVHAAPPPPQAATLTAPSRALVTPGREQEWALAIVIAAARRGLHRPAFDPSDFADPVARALLYRLLEAGETSGHGDWRPDLLEAVDDPWLAEGAARVRTVLDEVDRLTDTQLADSAAAIARQLREHRLATELEQLRALAQDPEAESTEQVRRRIAEINQEFLAISRAGADQPRGPGAVGQRPALVPSRFRIMPLDGGNA
jgi:DNA primase